MPVMNGDEATIKIRKFNDPYIETRGQKDHMIIAHTAITEDQFQDYKEKGFDGYLPKPFVHATLVKFLK